MDDGDDGRTRTTRQAPLPAVTLLALAALAACQDEGGSGEESGDGTGGPSCDYACNDEIAPVCSEKLWICSCHGAPAIPNGWNNIWDCPGCGSEANPPVDWCKETICGDEQFFDDWKLQEKPCYIGPSDDGVDETGAGSCGNWDPGADVSLVSRVYYLDQTFLDDLVAAPSPLVECDDTRFDEITSPVVGFQVQDSDAGELLYELGLRDGDIPLTLNSLPLETYADAVDAFNALYLTQGETSYMLEVKRGSSTIELEYEVQ